jgi:hypothetical protein
MPHSDGVSILRANASIPSQHLIGLEKRRILQMCEWEVVLVRPRGRVIGMVEAPDREAAIRRAIEEFKITDVTMKNQLTAQRFR